MFGAKTQLRNNRRLLVSKSGTSVKAGLFSEGRMMEWRSRLLLFVSYLSLIALLIPALGFASRQTPGLSNLTDNELNQIVVRLERTGCYGNCPAYKLTIHGDGRVEYEGVD